MSDTCNQLNVVSPKERVYKVNHSLKKILTLYHDPSIDPFEKFPHLSRIIIQ